MKKHALSFGMLLAALCMPQRADAQQHKDLSLITHYGIGIENVLEKGYSPVKYTGPAADFGLGFSGEWNRFRLEVDNRGSYSMSVDHLSAAKVHCINYHGTANLQYLWKECETGRCRLWAGGGLGDGLNIYQNTEGGNAMYSLSNFFDLNLSLTVERDFSFHKSNAEKNFTAFGKLNLAALSLVKRPGYAYMSADAMVDRPRITDGTYEHFAEGLSGISTEIGAAYRLKNHNRIACSYLWDYRSSGKKGAARYDHALHFLQFSFTFNLKYNG